MKKKRLLAILLALAMLVGMLPASVFAASTGAAAEDDGVSTAATETVSLTVGNSTTITVTGSYSASDFTYDSSVISVTTSVSTTATAGTKYESLSNGDSFYIYYTENGTTYYLVLSVSSGMAGNSSLTVSYTTDISQATLITYTTANSGSGGSLSFTSGNSTYYLGVSSSNGEQGGSSVSLTASTSASTTWSYSSSTGFSTSVTTNSGGNQNGQNGGGGSTTTTYYLSGTDLSSSASTYDYAISYTATYTTTITITGVSAGTTSITVGETTYSITVTSSSSSQPDEQPDGDGSDNDDGELDISAYRSDGIVYWDVDHVYTGDDDDGNMEFESGHSSNENTSLITSVTLGSTTSTNEDGTTTENANSVTMYDSTDENFGENDSENFTWNDEEAGTDTVVLSSVYDADNGEEDDEKATLTITPADGYYVTNVKIVCAAYVDAEDLRISPYQCATYKANAVYDESFTLSSASGSALTLSVDLSNQYFAHDGYTPRSTTTNDDGDTVYDYDDDIQAVYFILIEVAEVPTPAYVEYDYGNIVDYIDAYNEENETTLTSTSFSTASGWTDASTSNVYSDNQYDATTGEGTQGGLINGGVLTDDTQFEYIFDKTGTTLNSNWKHYANSISSEAIKEAAAAGYVFAGWAVTYYTSATAEEATDSSSYNDYIISFSNSSITTMVAAGSGVVVTGYVRLVAQWIKIDSSQVIDYGLDVELDVEEALLGDGFEAITDDVSSRTSTEDDYSDCETTSLNVAVDVTLTMDSGKTSVTGEYGTASITESGDDKDTVYTYSLSDEMTGIDTFSYTFDLTYGSTSTTTIIEGQAGTLYVIPATSMYYEESFGVTYGNYQYSSTLTYDNTVKTNGLIKYSLASAFWVREGSSTGGTQETGIVGTEDDSTYGADAKYLEELGDSDGSTMYVDTSNYAASFSYEFTGTGTAIYSRTVGGEEEGALLRVTVTDSDGEAVVTEYIDTRIVDNVSGSTTLYNIPIFSWLGDDYDTYTVSVLVYAEGAPVEATYTTDGQKDATTGEMTLDRAYKSSTTTTDEETGEKTTTYDYLYYVYSDSDCKYQLYYKVDNDGDPTDETSTNATDYPVYYTSTSDDLVSYTVSSDGTVTENKSTTSTADDDGSTTYYLAALYYLADNTSGGDFYLDGIRIYNPLGTEDDNVSSDDSEGENDGSADDPDEGTAAAEDEEEDTEGEESTETASTELTEWEIASAAYAEDDEDNNQVINITQELEAQYDAGYTSSETFVTLTDYYGDIISATYTEDHPNNEIYLDEGTDDDGDAIYSISFYLVGYDPDDYDFYIGLKAVDGAEGSSVMINDKKVSVNGSADCYYLIDEYLGTSTTLTVGDETVSGAYKVTITGNSGLIALTYIKITSGEAFVIGTDVNADTETETETEELTTASVSTLLSAASASEEETVNTVYILSAAAYSEASEDEDDTTTDEDMLDDDAMGVDPDDSEIEDEEDSTEPETEEDEEAVFEPETFTASISYLKLLRYASITVKTSSDVSYITVNGEVVTGRSFGSSGTKTFSYTASRVSSGTTYEIIAYNSDGVASEPITLTAK